MARSSCLCNGLMKSADDSDGIQAPVLDDFANVLDWLEAVEAFFLKHDYDTWLCIHSRYTPPTITIDNETRPKPSRDFTAEEKALHRMHKLARKAISSALPEKYLYAVDGCISAKETWDKLRAYGVLSTVRRMEHLYTLYDACTMQPSQTFDEFYRELLGIVRCLSNLGAVIVTPVLVRKILRSLTSRFRDKVTEIVDSEDLDTLGLGKLKDILENYEADMFSSKKWKRVVYVEDSLSSESSLSRHTARERAKWKKLEVERDSKSIELKNIMKVLVPSTCAINKEDSKLIEFKNIMKVMVPSTCANSKDDSESIELKNIMKVMVPASSTCAA